MLTTRISHQITAWLLLSMVVWPCGAFGQRAAGPDQRPKSNTQLETGALGRAGESGLASRVPLPVSPRHQPPLWQLRPALPPPQVAEDPNAPVVNVASEAARTPPRGGDLDPTIDVQITQEIIDKASELGSPQAMYEFVRNECVFQPYYGSQKGSVETLRQRAGNDYDLASLLIALLRASGISARYAVGMVEMPVSRVNSWLGVDDGIVAGSILFTNGMEGTAIVSGPNVVAVRARRVWVEAYVPRGFGSSVWVPLDPAFHLHNVTSGLDIPEEMALNAIDFIDEYYDPADPGVILPRTQTPLEVFKGVLTAYLDANHPGMTLEDVSRTREIMPETLGILPGSLPYTVRSRDSVFSEIPASRRYQIRFEMLDASLNTLINYTADLPTTAGKRVTLDYVGATQADVDLIEANGGIYQTPPSSVDLKPVLRIDGQQVAVGASGVGMGLYHYSDIYFLAPANAQGLPQNVVPAIYNVNICGASQAIAIGIEGSADRLLIPPPADDTEGTLSLNYDTGVDYLSNVRNDELELGELMHAFVTTDVTTAILHNVVKVTYNGFGVPQTFDWVGLLVDADRAIAGYWPVDRLDGPDEEPKDFLVIAGANGSSWENFIFERSFAQDSVSTMKILQYAIDTGVTVYQRWNTLPLPANTQPTSVRNALTAAINNGHEVTFPADPLTIGNVGTGQWTGTGWIDMDPTDGAAGYIISGNNNGGATYEVWPPEYIDLGEGDRTVVSVTIEITKPVDDSPNQEAVFSRDSKQKLVFEYKVHVTYDDGTMAELGPFTKTTQNTTKTFRPSNYRFHVWIARYFWWGILAYEFRDVSIVGVLIKEKCQAPNLDGCTEIQGHQVKDPPKTVPVQPPPPEMPYKAQIIALVFPEKDPAGNVLASAYAWSGDNKLSFEAPSAQITNVLAAGQMPSGAKDDQKVEVVVTIPGTTQQGYAKLIFNNAEPDEKHKMTVFEAKATAYRPQHGAGYAPFARTAVSDADEESPTLGPGIRINNPGDTDPNGEDDLIEVEFQIAPADLKFALRRDPNNLAAWQNRNKTNEIAFNGKKTDELPFAAGGTNLTVWIEWNVTSHGPADLIIEPLDEERPGDTLKFHSFQSIVVALGGEDQVPTNPVDPNHGTFVVAIGLYNQGYDVFMYDEDNVAANGAGATFNEVSTAIQRRAVSQVAIFGFSHGGGSTFSLATRLAGSGLGGYTIPFTSYVDAVENDSDFDIHQERRFPPGSLFHLNQYQVGAILEDGGLDGGPVPGSNPPPTGLNVETTPWGAGATHFTVDDFAQVRTLITTSLQARVTR